MLASVRRNHQLSEAIAKRYYLDTNLSSSAPVARSTRAKSPPSDRSPTVGSRADVPVDRSSKRNLSREGQHNIHKTQIDNYKNDCIKNYKEEDSV